MNVLNLLEVLVAIAVVGFVIARQVRGEPLRGKRLIVLPAVLAVAGLTRLGNGGRHLTTADIACLVIGAVAAAGIGAAQGARLRLESRGGALWARMPVRGLWLWLALVASRLVMTLVATAVDAHVAASTAPILMLLGVNRLGQAAVVAPRALASGVPFAPEKDSRPFDVLGTLAGLLGGPADPPARSAPQASSYPPVAPYPQATPGPQDARYATAHNRLERDVLGDQGGR
ncbi:hypothetical protein [Kitasatospora azatica]|uniref:hypothetical protein n=1 Tax=Kitasatospora azatica TaxID=58347 RepID=UPI000563F8CB|nr:hypothetical protein [Kitasatospora azatica]